MDDNSWYAKLDARWAARSSTGTTGDFHHENLVLRRVPTFAERVISASRTASWTAVIDEQRDPGAGGFMQIVGAPDSGVGAKHLHIGPPLPPFGLRSVMYTELIAVQEGYWTTCQTLGGSWEHTETLLLEDAPEGQTLARITGWWTKPAPPSTDFTELQASLNGLAAGVLERLASRAERRPADGGGRDGSRSDKTDGMN